MPEASLFPAHVAEICDCHRNTVINAEKRGLITPVRDRNGFRRYTLQDALKLKRALTYRETPQPVQE